MLTDIWEVTNNFTKNYLFISLDKIVEAEKRYKAAVEPCCRVRIYRLKTEDAEILYKEDNVKVTNKPIMGTLTYFEYK